jgi:death-on-curing protein
MISISEVILIQDILIEKFGGTRGIRDKGLLESAVSRPFQTFDTKDLYSTTIQKAAALIESIVTNHPFIDGNKRIGYVIMRLFLLDNGFDIVSDQDEKYDFVIKIASGKSDFEAICKWIEAHLKKSNRH